MGCVGKYSDQAGDGDGCAIGIQEHGQSSFKQCHGGSWVLRAAEEVFELLMKMVEQETHAFDPGYEM